MLNDPEGMLRQLMVILLHSLCKTGISHDLLISLPSEQSVKDMGVEGVLANMVRDFEFADADEAIEASHQVGGDARLQELTGMVVFLNFKSIGTEGDKEIMAPMNMPEPEGYVKGPDRFEALSLSLIDFSTGKKYILFLPYINHENNIETDMIEDVPIREGDSHPYIDAILEGYRNADRFVAGYAKKATNEGGAV